MKVWNAGEKVNHLDLNANFALFGGPLPAQATGLYGSATPSLTNFIIQCPDDATQPGKLQVSAAFGMAPSTGVVLGDDAHGSRVTLWSDMAAQPGSGNAWAANFLLGLAAGFTGHLGMGLEIDMGNGAGHRGDAAGLAGQRLTNTDGSLNPAAIGLNIDGSSVYRCTAAIRIAGVQTADGSNPALYNSGITFAPASVRRTSIADFTGSYVSIADYGSHNRWADLTGATYVQSAILMGPGHSINMVDNSAVEHGLISGRAADGAVVLGSGQAVVSLGTFTTPTFKMGTAGWLESIIGATESNSDFVSLSHRGGGGGTFGTRSSDSTTAGSLGGWAVGGFALNNNATQVQTVYASYLEARRGVGTGTAHGLEVGVVNTGSVVGIHPFAMGASGSTLSYWASAGRGDVTGNDLTAAFGIITNGNKFGAGIVFGANSLVIGSGVGQAIEMAPQHALLWFASDGSANSMIRSDATASGTGGIASMIFTDAGVVLNARNGVAAISIANGLNTNQSTKINGTFEVAGTATFDTTVAVTLALNANGGLNVYGTAGISGKLTASGGVHVTVPSYANDAAAGTAGLTSGDVYNNTTVGALAVKA